MFGAQCTLRTTPQLNSRMACARFNYMLYDVCMRRGHMRDGARQRASDKQCQRQYMNTTRGRRYARRITNWWSNAQTPDWFSCLRSWRRLLKTISFVAKRSPIPPLAHAATELALKIKIKWPAIYEETKILFLLLFCCACEWFIDAKTISDTSTGQTILMPSWSLLGECVCVRT